MDKDSGCLILSEPELTQLHYAHAYRLAAAEKWTSFG